LRDTIRPAIELAEREPVAGSGDDRRSLGRSRRDYSWVQRFTLERTRADIWLRHLDIL
jgi:hypothetical protein